MEATNINNFAFVPECGGEKRVIVRNGDVYYAGCFSGSYEELKKAIQNKYGSKSSYLDKLEELKKANLKDFKDVTADDNYAIRWASENGHLEVVKYLVQNGADVAADDNYAIRWAAKKGHLEVVKYLVQNGAKI